MNYDRSFYVIWYNCLRWLHDIIMCISRQSKTMRVLALSPRLPSVFIAGKISISQQTFSTLQLLDYASTRWPCYTIKLMGLDQITEFQRFFTTTTISSLKCYHSNNVYKILRWSTQVFQKAPTQIPEYICIFFFQKKEFRCQK